jgi:hypothetical protein
MITPILEPGFPVELCGATELHAAFREESRTSLLSTSAALQEIRDEGARPFPMELLSGSGLNAHCKPWRRRLGGEIPVGSDEKML